MTKVKFSVLPAGSMFVAGNGYFRKTMLETIQEVETNARDARLGDLWLFDEDDLVLDVTTSMVK